MTTINLELKSVKNKRQKKLCATCLSFFNSNLLCSITEDIKGILKCLLYDFGIDEFFQSLPPGKELKLCCKCNATLKDMVAFKERAQHSFYEIKKYWFSNEQNENPRRPVMVHGQGIKPTTTLTPQQCTLKDKVPKEHTNENQKSIGIVKEEVADIDDSNDDTIYESEVAARLIEKDDFKDNVADIAYLNDNVFIKAETDIDTSGTATNNHSITMVPISNMDPITNKVCFTCLSLTFRMQHKMFPITEDIKCMLKRLLYDYDIKITEQPVIVHLQRNTPTTNITRLSCSTTVKDNKKGPINENQNPMRTLNEELTDIINPFDTDFIKEENDTDMMCELEAAAEQIKNYEVLKIDKVYAADITDRNEKVFIKTETDVGTTYLPESTVMKHNENPIENINVPICNAKLKETDKISNHNIVSLVKNNNAIIKPNKDNAHTSSVVKHITIKRFSKEAGDDPDLEKSIQSTILFRKQNIDHPVEISNANKSNSNTIINVSFDEKKFKGEGNIGIGEEVMLKPKCEEGTFTIENLTVVATLESPNVVILSPKIVSTQGIVQGSILSDSDSENALESDKTSSTYGCQAMGVQGESYREQSQQKMSRRHTEDDGTIQTKKFKRHSCFYS